jgi:hypothetical protein
MEPRLDVADLVLVVEGVVFVDELVRIETVKAQGDSEAAQLADKLVDEYYALDYEDKVGDMNELSSASVARRISSGVRLNDSAGTLA